MDFVIEEHQPGQNVSVTPAVITPVIDSVLLLLLLVLCSEINSEVLLLIEGIGGGNQTKNYLGFI